MEEYDGHALLQGAREGKGVGGVCECVENVTV